MISGEDKDNVPKPVRAMQLNIKCTKDEGLAKIDGHNKQNPGGKQ